jgi:hypothetical protein
MNLKKGSLWACSIVLCCFSMSCTDDTVATKGAYSTGVFVVCEGGFQKSNGTISFFNRTDTTVTNNLFENANGAAKLGDVVQSMAIDGSNAYVVVNNSNKVMVVNASDFVKTGSIDGCVFPRSFLPISTIKAYISEYGKDTGSTNSAGAIRVYDFGTKTIAKRILLNTRGADRMLLTGNKVYVANDGGNAWNAPVAPVDSVISVVTTLGDSVVKKIYLGAGAYNVKGMELDVNNDLWVLCTGDWGQAVPTGKLIKLHGEAVERSFDIPVGASSLVVDIDKYNLYFVANNKIYTKDILNFGATPPKVWMESPNFKSLYGLGFDPKSGFLYVADAPTFTAGGQFHVINPSDKAFKYSKTVGIGPNGFYFK